MNKPEEKIEKLHIFVNRVKYDEADGVAKRMTGAQIAALGNVPADNGEVERETGPDKGPIAMNQTVDVKNGDHFIATRLTVDGGHGR